MSCIGGKLGRLVAEDGVTVHHHVIVGSVSMVYCLVPDGVTVHHHVIVGSVNMAYCLVPVLSGR
jgi:hypothetical protein